jgi:hypothetical protein
MVWIPDRCCDCSVRDDELLLSVRDDELLLSVRDDELLLRVGGDRLLEVFFALRLVAMRAPSWDQVSSTGLAGGVPREPSAKRFFVAREVFFIDIEDAGVAAAAAALGCVGPHGWPGPRIGVVGRGNHDHIMPLLVGVFTMVERRAAVSTAAR